MPQATTRLGSRSYSRKNVPICEINVAGLFGILLVLWFILVSWLPPLHYHLYANADRMPALHATLMPGALREDAMRTTITRDGSIYFRNSKIALTDLPKLIGEGVKRGAEKRIYLVVDARAKYQDVEPVLDQIRLAGIQDVTFLTDQPFLHS